MDQTETIKAAATVMIPTVGDQALVLPCVQRLLEATRLPCWELMIVSNPVEATAPMQDLLRQQVEAAVSTFSMIQQIKVSLRWIQMPGPAGWTGAVNAGVRALLRTLDSSPTPPVVTIINDDVLVTAGWLSRMIAALDTKTIILQGEAGMGGEYPLRSAASFGKIGMVGPCSNEIAGTQKVQPPDVKMGNGSAFIADGHALLDRFGGDFARQSPGHVMAASFLSGMCVAYRRECLYDLLEINKSDDGLDLLRPCYGTGGYDDNDIAVRADRAGWRLVVARDVYVHHLGHKTLDAHFPEAQRGLANMSTYLRQWEAETDIEHRVIAVYRVRWEVPWDLVMLTKSLQKVASMVDGIAILATNSPAEIVQSSEWRQGQLVPNDAQLIASCAEAGAGDSISKEISEALVAYMEGIVSSLGLEHTVNVTAGIWSGKFNERDERNAAIQLGLTLAPGWMLSVDHDEVPEDRLTRAHLQRLMRHPDPAVGMYDMGWLNHWDNSRLVRVDTPWAHGYKSSMRGFRLWRVNNLANQVILAGNENGLHCGNIPDQGENSKRVSSFRFRHFGYMRHADRVRKHARYRKQDPSPSALLTQGVTESGAAGSYDHLIREEGMRLSPYVAKDSIGLTMLYHKGEQLFDLFRHLDLAYGLVDQIVLVWTGEIGTGPDEDTEYVARRFGARWVHQPMNDHMGAARNAGVDALRELGCDWCLVMDPDEHFSPHFTSLVSIRRMAECSDSWAWMFRFRNHRPDGKWNWSENTRFFRLDDGILRFGQRVHETLEGGIAKLTGMGVHPQVRFAPFIVEHFGLSRGDEYTQKKLQRYTRLLCKQIEDAPMASPGAWVSLGLQFGNDGRPEDQWACYEQAMACAGHGYLPFREAALHHLRIGHRFLEQAQLRLSTSHDLHKPTKQLVDVLAAQAPAQPVLGSARRGHAVPPEVDLQRLLDLAAKARAAGEGPARPMLPAGAVPYILDGEPSDLDGGPLVGQE